MSRADRQSRQRHGIRSAAARPAGAGPCEVEVVNHQERLPVDIDLFQTAVHTVLAEHGLAGVVDVAVVDDATIQALNRRWLNHDYATDALSFLHESDPEHIEGEIIVSADTAARMAGQYQWPAEHELLLYVIHGALHLVGYDDASDAQRSEMRVQEMRVLSQLGLAAPKSAENEVPGGSAVSAPGEATPGPAARPS